MKRAVRLAAGAMLVVFLAVSMAESQTGPRKPVAPATRAKAETASKAEFDRLAQEAAAAREEGRLEASLALYEKAVQIQPDWTEGYWYLGTGYYELDRYTEARNAFRRVVRDREDDGPAHAFKGLCEFHLENYDTALADLVRASELGVANQDLLSVVRYHTAIVMTRLEQYEFALLTLQPFAHQGNDNPRVIEAFGLAALRVPMLPNELPAERREMVLLAGRGAYYQAARLVTPARRALEQLVDRYPDMPNVHYAFGVHLLSGEPDRALEAFKKELRLFPGHVASMLQMAFEHIKRSEWEEARPWAEEAVQLEPGNFAGRRALGQVLLEIGDTDGAVDHLQIGVKLAPDSPSLRFTLARAYQKAGRTADAERERAEFLRLERLTRTGRFGEQAVGGVDSSGKPQ